MAGGQACVFLTVCPQLPVSVPPPEGTTARGPGRGGDRSLEPVVQRRGRSSPALSSWMVAVAEQVTSVEAGGGQGGTPDSVPQSAGHSSLPSSDALLRGLSRAVLHLWDTEAPGSCDLSRVPAHSRQS